MQLLHCAVVHIRTMLEQKLFIKMQAKASFDGQNSEGEAGRTSAKA